MKINLLVLIAAALFIAAVSNSGGPPPGHTGAPGEKTCSTTGCHAGTVGVNEGKGKMVLSLENGLTEYEPGKTYAITIKMAEPEQHGRMGFQLTALSTGGASAGKLKASNLDVSVTNGEVAGATRQYARQTNDGSRTTVPKARAWSVQWTAPQAGSGPVTLYAAGLGANGNRQADADDRTYTTMLKLGEKK